MAETTAISWTDHTFNPWWGCWKIADECKNCYADDLANRYAPGLWGRTAPRRFFGDNHWNEPRKWNRRAAERGVRERVFVGSMCDWAERHVVPEIAAQQDATRAQLWKLIRECHNLDWLLLTKRIEDAAELLPWMDTAGVQIHPPWPHVWLGGTAGTTASVLKIVPTLRTIPAAVRFISGEPLLENIPSHVWDAALGADRVYGDTSTTIPPIDWLIIGDESGRNRRPARPEWVRTARDAAERHGVAFHFKQWNDATGDGIEGDKDRKRKIHLPMLDGERHAGFPSGGVR